MYASYDNYSSTSSLKGYSVAYCCYFAILVVYTILNSIMATDINQAKIDEVLTRSIDRIYPDRKTFEEMLKTGKPLRIYMGIDPTATYVHLGHATNYIILKRFHDLGHKIVVLMGDFTAMIGDPSDKSAARQRLTKEDVQTNLATFKEQIGKILNFDDRENPIEIRFNSDWLAKLTFEDSIELASHFTVQQMIERDNFQKRLKDNKPLYVHEFFYPLMQGYDSVALEVDVEIGGTDQTFNMLAGRTLVKDYQKREKIVVTTTLLENPVTGEKLMSKSLGTGIGLNEDPNMMYGKTMALPDEAIIQCFIDCTMLSLDEISKLEKEMQSGANPRDLKMRLAKEIVTMYHGAGAAAKAEEYFVTAFQKKGVPDEIEEIKVASGSRLADVLLENNLVKSKSDFRRLIDEGAVGWLEGEKITDPNFILTRAGVLKVGKKRFVRILT